MTNPRIDRLAYLPPAYQERRINGGFTLIELMIVVAIVAILVSIAVPQYQDYVLRGNRAKARSALLETAQWMERGMTASGTYVMSLPASFASLSGGAYAISLSGTASSFVLTATPQGNQTKDACGNLTLSDTGVKGVSGALSVLTCWEK